MIGGATPEYRIIVPPRLLVFEFFPVPYVYSNPPCINFENFMCEIEFLFLEFTSTHQKIKTAYQSARESMKKRIKNDVELTKWTNIV